MPALQRPGQLFVAVQDMEESPFMGDSSFWRILDGLAPLLVTADTDGAFADRTFEVTGLGREVLAGLKDHVRLHGIDRWIGGVHLQGPESRWRWNGHRLQTVA